MNIPFTMLIAEDDIISFELYKVRLDDLHLKLLYAKNGQVAVDMVKKNLDINLVLMDICMPKLNGYEATKQIRQFNKDIPIIAQTAFAVIPDKKNIFDAGFTDFILKPIEEKKLFDLVKRYMNEVK